jgi:predicted XRE-type DNA-binding protein
MAKVPITPGGKPVEGRVTNPEHFAGYQNGEKITVPLMDDSGIHVVAEIIKERIDRGRDCPILVTGDRGCGKSTLILEIALEVDPKLTIEKIAFRLEDFARIFNENPPGGGGVYPQVILDEAGHALFAQDWMNRAQKIVAKQLIISRVKRQVIWFAVPRRMQLNNQLRDMPYMWIHVSEPAEYKQGYAQVHLSPPGPDQKWYLEKYWKPWCAFVYPQLIGGLWDRYEEKKIAFVNEVTAETANGNAKKDDVLNIIHNLRKQRMSHQEIAEIVGLSRGRISQLLSSKTTNIKGR